MIVKLLKHIEMELIGGQRITPNSLKVKRTISVEHDGSINNLKEDHF